MKITSTRLIAMGIAAISLAALTVSLYIPRESARPDVEKDALLIQGLDLNKVQKITVKSKDNQVTLKRVEDRFVVGDRSDYPAANGKVNSLITKCLDIRGAGKASGSAESHAEFGVKEDGDDAVVVKFFGDGETPLVGLVIGKYAERGSGSYVRLTGQNAVYVAKESVWVSKSPTDFIDTDLLKVDKKDLQKVAVNTPEGSYILSKDKDTVVLDSVPEGKRVKQTELNNVFEALTGYFYFSDVAKEGDQKLQWQHLYSCQLSTHLTYILQLAKADDKHYLRIRAMGPSPEEIQRQAQIRGNESKEQLAAKDAVLTAMDKANKFNEEHNGWIYEISNWTAEKLMKPKADLVEDMPTADNPEEVSASHILIPYQGAERAGEDVTRTRDEAKKLAEELLVKAKAPDADFAALAKEFSSCPSKEKGGDLGAFKKGAMDPNFDEATRKLKVGEISGVVETPFGFHIIKRTK